MSFPDDFSRHTPMTEATMQDRVRTAVRMELEYLRWPKWRKNMDMRDVLIHHGVDAFAEAVAKHLIRSNTVLFQGPLEEGHSTPGSGMVMGLSRPE